MIIADVVATRRHPNTNRMHARTQNGLMRVNQPYATGLNEIQNHMAVARRLILRLRDDEQEATWFLVGRISGLEMVFVPIENGQTSAQVKI